MGAQQASVGFGVPRAGLRLQMPLFGECLSLLNHLAWSEGLGLQGSQVALE